MTSKATITGAAFMLAHRMHVFHFLARRLPPHLTVLVYHRIDDITRPGFHGDPDLVSATPETFARQLDYLVARYTPIDERMLITWLDGMAELPDRPLLITFDDGYRDNLLHAAGILNARNVPALLFVCTRFIAGELEFYWDWLADALLATAERTLVLPLIGRITLTNSRSRRDARRAFIAQAKQISEHERLEAITAVSKVLRIDQPRRPNADQHLDWRDLQRLRQLGFTIGGHTVSHPILSRLTDAEAVAEIAESCRKIAGQLDAPVNSFAYPNGMADDFNEVHQHAAAEAGVKLAFSVSGCVAPLNEIRRRPLAIDRIGVYQHDKVPRLAAKLAQLGGKH
jgi:peptidoglycan/xylan/chitin deacetylase (PgdA/CDA1 family)